MDLKKIVMNLRKDLVIHGYYPVVVKIPFNMGHIVDSKVGYYVVTLTKDNELYFHGLSKYRMVYDSKKDFVINLSAFKNYTFQIIGKKIKQIMLINDNDFLPFQFFANVKTSYEGECNAAYLCKAFDSMGIKEITRLIDSSKELTDGQQE